MKNKFYSLLLMVLIPLNVLSQRIDTEADYNPIVIARKFNASYGVRPDAILAILQVYAQQGDGPQERKTKTEQLIQQYSIVVDRPKSELQLSREQRALLGIEGNPGLLDALNWDMFASKYFLSTQGAYSPTVVANGNVRIWFGVPAPTLQALASRLESHQVKLAEFEKQLRIQVHRYEALKHEFETFGEGNPLVAKAQQLIDEGKLDEAERLLDNGYLHAQKRYGYLNYLLGKTQELSLRYDSAMVSFAEAIGTDSANASYWVAYGSILETKGKFNDAISAYEQGMNHLPEHVNDDGLSKSVVLNHLGTALYARGDFDKALLCYERAKTFNTSIMGKINPDVAHDFRNLGSVAIAKGKYEVAIDYYLQAYEIDTLIYDEAALIDDLNGLGTAYYQNSDCRIAASLHQKALGFSEKLHGKSHPFTSICLSSLGLALQRCSSLDSANMCYQTAMEIDTLIFGSDHPRVAEDWNNLGMVHIELGEFEASANYLQRAVGLYTKYLGVEHPNTANAINNLAVALDYGGKSLEAVIYLGKALDLAQMLYHYEHPELAKHLNNYGRAMIGIGKIDMGIMYCEEAMRIDSISMGTESDGMAKDLRNLAYAAEHQRDFDKAIRYYQRAIAIDTLRYGVPHLDVAMNWNSLGNVWRDSGNYAMARGAFEQALKIYLGFYRQTDYLPQKTLVGLSATFLLEGQSLLDANDFEQALPLFDLSVQKAILAKDLSFTLICKMNLGACLKGKGEFTEGLKNLEEGLATADLIHEVIDGAKIVDKAAFRRIEFYTSQLGPLFLKRHVRRIQYHMLGCLKGLGRETEAAQLALSLVAEAKTTNDEKLLCDLENEGWWEE